MPGESNTENHSNRFYQAAPALNAIILLAPLVLDQP